MTHDIPSMMTAIGISQPGSADMLQPEDRPVPAPASGQVLIKVAAAGINRPDVLQRQGHYPPPPGAPDIPGLEVSGTIVACGQDVSRWSVGDRVTALVIGGGYAEYCLADETSALPIPAGLSDVEAAALPETFFTVWSNVFQRAALKPGEIFMVHGGTSGIGTTAIQLAKAFGSTVYATAGSDEKCDACLRLGADLAINYNTQDFVQATKEASGGRGVNVILDMVGGDYVGRNYKAAATEGRIVQIAFLGGSIADVDFTRLMLKRLVHTGSTLRARSTGFKAKIAAELEEQVWPLIAQDKIRPVMDSTFPLREASKAHARMETSGHVGKIVLTAE